MKKLEVIINTKMANQKVYKKQGVNNINMLPGDPKGSPEESFSKESNFSRSNDLIKSVYKYVLLTKKDFDECLLVN